MIQPILDAPTPERMQRLLAIIVENKGEAVTEQSSMSVGGTIVDIVEVAADRWWIDTIDKSDLLHGGRTVAIYCDPRPEQPQVGDALWWQGGWCFWTPRVYPDGRSDVKLKKIGYSGVNHPDKPKVQP